MKLFGTASWGVLASALLSGAAHAQTAAPQSNTSEVEAVIVTANKRAENLQKVPLSVVAATGDALRERGITNLQDLRQIDPSLNFRMSISPQSSAFAVRGVGTSTYSAGLEQSVSTLIDGVILNDASAAAILADIDRVEVLRGPQGMLFGKNASAGVISITTKDPKIGVFEGETHLSFGENNERVLQGIVNVPINDDLAARLVVTHNHLDPWFHYPVFNKDVGGIDINGVRAKLRWQPSDKFNAVLSFDANYSGEYCCNNVTRYVPAANSPTGVANAQYGIVASPNNFSAAADNLPEGNGRVAGGALNLEYKLPGGYTLTAITGYRQTNRRAFYDADYATFSNVDRNGGATKNANFSQELRITSPVYERFDYVAGLYYFNSRVRSLSTQEGSFHTPPFGSATTPPNLRVLYSGSNDATVTSDHAAVFGQGRLRVTDTLTLTAGARYTRDDLSLQYLVYPTNPTGALYRPTTPFYVGYDGPYPSNVPCITKAQALAANAPATENCFPAYREKTDADNLSWRVSVQNQFTPDIMVYGTVARGYKGPGFSALGLSAPLLRAGNNPQQVRPEIPTTYEVGVKASLFDRRLVINADVFQTDYKDFQQQVFSATPAGFVTLAKNAGDVSVKGLEVNATVRPVPELTISAGTTVLDAHYGDFAGVPCYVYLTNPATGTTARQAGCDPASNSINASGNRLAGAPEVQVNLSSAYDRPNMFGAYSGHIRLNYVWQSDVFYNPNGDPLQRQEPFGLLGGEVGIGADDDRWRLTLYATNILNKHWAAAISAAPNQAINPGGTVHYFGPQAFRHVGVRLDARF
ncbi:TonB-dependent receptor [Phenylobacterium sp. VNQ135]|uniref:TonB-dependent receptor n=1 Tax=Phenylobacterium sp. VNQ135 TaxID=3400922 RepID=UPI003C012F62